MPPQSFFIVSLCEQTHILGGAFRSPQSISSLLLSCVTYATSTTWGCAFSVHLGRFDSNLAGKQPLCICNQPSKFPSVCGNDSSDSNLSILLDGEKNVLLCPLLYSPTFPSLCLPCLSLPFAFHSFISFLAFRFFFPLTYCCKSFTKPLSSYTTLPFPFLYNISLILSLWSLYFSFCFCPYTWFPLLL